MCINLSLKCATSSIRCGHWRWLASYCRLCKYWVLLPRGIGNWCYFGLQIPSWLGGTLGWGTPWNRCTNNHPYYNHFAYRLGKRGITGEREWLLGEARMLNPLLIPMCSKTFKNKRIVCSAILDLGGLMRFGKKSNSLEHPKLLNSPLSKC